MSNLLAALGSAQLDSLSEKVTIRRTLFQNYKTLLPNLKYQHELTNAQSNRWLSAFLLPSKSNPAYICQEFEKLGIETRQMWKPMHLQPFCKNFITIGDTSICETLFHTGLCLPSGSNLSYENQILITQNLNNLLSNT
jgi:dTDP-4-amino-4,6-dideoxygalactose transaminase